MRTAITLAVAVAALTAVSPNAWAALRPREYTGSFTSLNTNTLNDGGAWRVDQGIRTAVTLRYRLQRFVRDRAGGYEATYRLVPTTFVIDAWDIEQLSMPEKTCFTQPNRYTARLPSIFGRLDLAGGTRRVAFRASGSTAAQTWTNAMVCSDGSADTVTHPHPATGSVVGSGVARRPRSGFSAALEYTVSAPQGTAGRDETHLLLRAGRPARARASTQRAAGIPSLARGKPVSGVRGPADARRRFTRDVDERRFRWL